MTQPDYIFETSWEVCNKVGGIYAVLSTRAAIMQQKWPDHVCFLGPDFGEHSDIYFKEDTSLMPSLLVQLAPFKARIGRWQVPGEPIAILLRWEHLLEQKDDIYAWAWDNFGVKSHAAYGDYDESCLFGYAAGQVAEIVMKWLNQSSVGKKKVRYVAHSNEWQTAFMLFYLRHFCPEVRTLFTTHATSIGRSIAGNGKPLYDYFTGYHGDQMAEELNMVSKHSVEKQAAYWADCFTTVSDITARECAQLLDKPVDIVTPNGFEHRFVQDGVHYLKARQAARTKLIQTAQYILHESIEKNACLLCISGRQEWKNKGIDVFLDAIRRLGAERYNNADKRHVVAFVMVPYLEQPFIRIGRTSIIFVPYYLDGKDSLLKMTYYDLLIGMDMSIFPSYYEPWGYTPLESVAFHVPTITTSLSGFGVWALQQTLVKKAKTVAPVTVIERTDSNYGQVVEQITKTIHAFLALPALKVDKLRLEAAKLGQLADWKHFFPFYEKAYDIALTKR